MVSDRTPGPPEAPAGSADPWDRVGESLDALVEHNRSALFDAWREFLERSPNLKDEMDRTVRHLQIFFNKWVVEIIIVLGQRGTLRFTELKRSLEGISGRTLSQRLQDLEAQDLVHRELYNEMPIRVEYSLTEKGMDVAMLALPMVLYLRARTNAPDANP